MTSLGGVIDASAATERPGDGAVVFHNQIIATPVAAQARKTLAATGAGL
jgi:hypothetical protein